MSYKLQFCVFAFCAVIASSFGGVNKSFGNCETNGEHFAYAPEWLNNTHCSLLTSNDYATANWWPVTDTPPVCETNMTAHAYGWAKHDYQVPREVIDWHCRTNTSGEEEWYPVTNTVYDTKYWIERLYNQVLKPIEKPMPRKFSRLSMYVGLCTMGEWNKVEAWLAAKDFNGVNGLKAFELATTVDEDHAMFKPLVTEAKAMLGWDDAMLNTFLDACVWKD